VSKRAQSRVEKRKVRTLVQSAVQRAVCAVEASVPRSNSIM
jgi:hypothetical protein